MAYAQGRPWWHIRMWGIILFLAVQLTEPTLDFLFINRFDSEKSTTPPTFLHTGCVYFVMSFVNQHNFGGLCFITLIWTTYHLKTTPDKEEWINIELKCMTEMWKKKGGKLKTVGLLQLFFFSFLCLLVKSSGETWCNRIWIEVVLYPNFLSKTGLAYAAIAFLQRPEKNIKIDFKRLTAATVPRFLEVQYHAIYC